MDCVKVQEGCKMHPMWQEPLAVPGGDRQSPVDIAVKKSVFDAELKPLVTSYDPHTCQQIWNNGYSFLVEYDDTKDKNTLTGGPLQDQFRLCQFHFHWGETNEWGSEHTVDRRLFPAELHLVHWNADKYSLFEEAVMEDNGLAVIGVFLKVGKRHEGLQKLVDALPTIRHKDSIVEFNRFDPSCLLPGNINDYWTYHGSLTTPPLTESVTWIIMKQHIEVSHDQIKANVPTLTCGHEFWVVTERTRSRIQAAAEFSLQSGLVIQEGLGVDLLLLHIEISQLRWLGDSIRTPSW
nr:carbonic anhydrase 5A, mitochondrial isoform X3 [Nothobranchius furzeri]